MIRVRTMNWESGKGRYELEQIYTAYAHQSYSTCQVRYTRFLPKQRGVVMGAGLRKKPNQNRFFQQGGVVITAGPEEVMDPDEGTISSTIDLIASAMIVKSEYRPIYQFTPDFKGNHTFKVTPRDGRFEYLIAGAWSEGAILNTYEGFEAYVRQVAREYESPVRAEVGNLEERPSR